MLLFFLVFFFQAEDGIRDLVRSRGLGDVYKRQVFTATTGSEGQRWGAVELVDGIPVHRLAIPLPGGCLLYTSDAADERSSVDLGGRRII